MISHLHDPINSTTIQLLFMSNVQEPLPGKDTSISEVGPHDKVMLSAQMIEGEDKLGKEKIENGGYASNTNEEVGSKPTTSESQSASHKSGEPELYSAFSKRTKVWITVMITISSFISPVTANIYFPALNPIAKDLGVSTSLINLTLTTYMILQGLSPTIFGDLGDMVGRRPAYILALSIYLLANIGLALQRSYASLMILRCVQSAGSSGTIALGFAVIADIASTAERGKYMGIVGAGINVGPAIGPVIGGVLSHRLGWPSLFWFLAIFVFVWLIPFVLAVPETCRKVVGNGSIPSQRWNRTLLEYLKPHGPEETHQPLAKKLRFPNPLRTLAVILEKEVGTILFVNSMLYLSFILTAATLSTLFKDIYHYDDLVIGLCYLPYGLGACVGVVAQGYILDWNYRRIARKLGVVVSRKYGDDLANFPIETARIQSVYPMLCLGVASVIGYGWVLEAETHVAVPLTLTFAIGTFVTTAFNVLGTLIIDLYPEAPATATAANNLVRCLMGAAATAVIELMLKSMGRGWCFTFLACLIIVCMPLLRIVERCGPQWRAERLQRKAEKDEKRATELDARVYNRLVETSG